MLQLQSKISPEIVSVVLEVQELSVSDIFVVIINYQCPPCILTRLRRGRIRSASLENVHYRHLLCTVDTSTTVPAVHSLHLSSPLCFDFLGVVLEVYSPFRMKLTPYCKNLARMICNFVSLRDHHLCI